MGYYTGMQRDRRFVCLTADKFRFICYTVAVCSLYVVCEHQSVAMLRRPRATSSICQFNVGNASSQHVPPYPAFRPTS
jgi:hypothetical protein